MKTPLTLLLLSLSLTHAFSQKSTEYSWIASQIIYTSDSTGVANLFYNKEQSGIAFIQADGTAEKELPLPGKVFGIAKWKGNILGFYTNEWKFGKLIKEIHAVLVDGKTKTVIADKLVYANPGNNQIEPTLGNDEQGNFHDLLVRISELDGNAGLNLSEKASARLHATIGLIAVSLSDQLQPTLHSLSSAAIGADFISSYANQKGEIAVVSHLNGQLIAEEFGQDGQLVKKLTAPLNFKQLYSDEDDSRRGSFDPRAENILTFSLANQDARGKHQLLSLFVFDFAGGKVLLQESQELNKDYFSKFKDNPDLGRAKHFKDVEGLKPDGILYLGDKLVVFDEIRYHTNPAQPSAAVRFESEGVIASFYDRQYHLVHQLFLDRNYECFNTGGRGLSYHLRDGKILAFGNELDDIAMYGHFCFLIDPEKYTLDKKKPEWGEGSRAYGTTVNTIFWFRDFLLKSQSGKGSHTNSYLVKINYW